MYTEMRTWLNTKKILIFCNLVFLTYFLHYFIPIKPSLLYLSMGLITFIVPGLAWVNIIKDSSKNIITLIFGAVFLSTIVIMISLGLHILFKTEIQGINHCLILLVITNVGFFVGNRSTRNRQVNNFTKRQPFILISIIFIFLYVALYLFASKVVPPLDDNDLELQGTAYGLARHFKPYLLTDRKIPFYFAHPPLIHFYTANIFLLSGELENVKFYYDFSREAQKIEQELLSIDQVVSFYSPDIGNLKYRIDAIDSEEVILERRIQQGIEIDYNKYLPDGKKNISLDLLKKARIWKLIKDEYNQFLQQPNLLLTRSANIFLGSLTGVLIFYLIYQLAGSLTFALISVILYFSFPSVLVLTISEIYSSITNFALLVMFSFCVMNDKKSSQANLIFSGIFAGLSNHKMFIFPLSIIIKNLFQRCSKHFSHEKILGVLKNRIVIGFILGTMTFWAYGFLVNARVFLLDHFHYHIVNRILHRNVLGYEGYPSLFELWNNFLCKEFLIVSIPLALLSIKKSNSNSGLERLLAIWFIVGAITFSVIDWREITHLSLIILPLLISTMVFISRQKGPIKFLLSGVLVYIIIKNILFLSQISQDFSLMLTKLGWN